MNSPTQQEKIAFIYNDIASNYAEFLKQSKIKLRKHSHLVGCNDHIELVSDVVYSIIDKLDNSKSCNRYYNMTKKDTLKLYILKAISTNTSFFTAPFLRKKLKEHNRICLYNAYNSFEAEDEEDIKLEQEQREKDLNMALTIKAMFERPTAITIFGPEWKYYKQLFFAYVDNPSATYQSLADKYDIPVSSISFHIRFVKRRIREELQKNSN